MIRMQVDEILKDEKSYRADQVYKAWFDLRMNSYSEITTLPALLREKLSKLSWLAVKEKVLKKSNLDNTQKAALELSDGKIIETVLMGRKSLKKTGEKARYTICVSSQVGCAMRCVFCATGIAGFCRNLLVQEIVDQYRYWQGHLGDEAEIDNIVVMGQGEPLLNYDNVKSALNTLIKYANVGPTKITISTCGIPAAMDRLVEDKDFPQARLAISLHSAIEETRKKIMPSHQRGFFNFLLDWAPRYHKSLPSRSHFIGIEYLMLKDFNDDEKHLKALLKLCSKIGRVRINLIPYNIISSLDGGRWVLVGSDKSVIERWHDTLMKAGFVSTIRYSQGQDIEAACGQLSGKLSVIPAKAGIQKGGR